MNVQTPGRAPTAPTMASTGQPDGDELLRMYHTMLLIRHFEDKVWEMYTRNRIGGYLHDNTGEEAAVVGAISALRSTDYLFSTYREHGHAIAKGTDPRLIMAELFGKETGTSRGRGGSMHIFDPAHRFMGGYGIVGQSIPIAVGAAFAQKYQGTGDAVMATFGDGATNIGPFYESLNLGKLWRLPIVFVIINNGYGMGTAVARASSIVDLWRKGASFDIPGEPVDGMDVLACRQACSRALERARADGEPTLLELKTYRYRGHSVADAGKVYRSEEEIRKWRERDPIQQFRRLLLDRDLLSEEHERELESDVNEIIASCVQFAEQSADPKLADLTKYVYVDEER